LVSCRQLPDIVALPRSAQGCPQAGRHCTDEDCHHRCNMLGRTAFAIATPR
jgi:hypothetical protein